MLLNSMQSTGKSGKAVGVLETSFDGYDGSLRSFLPVNRKAAGLTCSAAHEASHHASFRREH